MLTEEAVGLLLGAPRSLPPSDVAEEPGPARPDVRQRAGCAQVDCCQIWRKRSPKLTQRAGLACLATPEICVERRKNNAQVGEQPSQSK